MMDPETAALMGRVVTALTSKEASELSAKLRKDAAHSVQQGVQGSGFAWNKAIGVHHQHYKDLSEAVWQEMLRVVQDADATVEPVLAKELKDRYDCYLADPLGRIRPSIAKYVQMLGSEPIPHFDKVEEETRNRNHNEIDLWVRRAIAENKKMANLNITYNLTGSNPKVNINSTDYSITIQNAQPIFQALRDAIQRGVDDLELREKLVKKSDEMEAAVKDKPKYLTKYSEFMALAANHVAVFSQLIPAVTQFLQ